MLDTVHFNGQNTNLEAFSMALPVITLPGVMQRERHTAGMLAAMGHELAQDLQASDSDEYADKAVSMAPNPAAREDVRRRIAAARAELNRKEAFIRACEAVFLRLAGGGEQTLRRLSRLRISVGSVGGTLRTDAGAKNRCRIGT